MGNLVFLLSSIGYSVFLLSIAHTIWSSMRVVVEGSSWIMAGSWCFSQDEAGPPFELWWGDSFLVAMCRLASV